jgi:hypothetical protein
MRTAEDGSATAYLYQVLNPVTVTTVVDGAFTTKTSASLGKFSLFHCRHHADDQRCVASRTVIASASGWIEHFEDNSSIACGLVNATFGECLKINGTNTVTSNHGAPTPQRFLVSSEYLRPYH